MRVTICDVGPRDGLQSEAVCLAPETRADLGNRLAHLDALIGVAEWLESVLGRPLPVRVSRAGNWPTRELGEGNSTGRPTRSSE